MLALQSIFPIVNCDFFGKYVIKYYCLAHKRHKGVRYFLTLRDELHVKLPDNVIFKSNPKQQIYSEQIIK